LVLRQCARRDTEVAGDFLVGDLTPVEGAVQINRRIDNEIAFFDSLPGISGELRHVKLLSLRTPVRLNDSPGHLTLKLFSTVPPARRGTGLSCRRNRNALP